MNKFLVLSMLLFVASNAYADEITCYNYGKKIYHAYVHDVFYTQDGFYVMTENKSNRRVFSNGDCLIKVNA